VARAVGAWRPYGGDRCPRLFIDLGNSASIRNETGSLSGFALMRFPLDPSRSAKPLTDSELDAFDDLLRAPNFPAATMSLEALDGFIAALIAGPSAPPAEQYLPLIFGGVEPSFESDDQARKFHDYFQRHWNTVVACLNVSRRDLSADNMYLPLVVPIDSPPGPVPASAFEAEARRTEDIATEDSLAAAEPLEPREGDWSGQHWAWGFMEVLNHWSADWEPLWQSERADELLAPVTALELGYFADAPEEKVDYMQLVGQAAQSAYEIRDFWRKRSAGPDDGRPVRKAAMPGRNDLCPCGSGKKYKKCHGAPTLH